MFKHSLAFLVFACFSFCFDPAFAENPLYIGSHYTPPLSTRQGTGLLDRIAAEAFRRLDIKIEITHLPAERSLINANSGVDDGDLVRIAGLSEQYPNLIMVPEKLMDFSLVAFAKDETPVIEGWKSLARYNNGIVRGWKLMEWNIPPEKLIQVENLDLLLLLLEKKRIDLAVFELYQAQWNIDRFNRKGIKAIFPPLEKREMYLYLNKRHKNIIDKLADSIKSMKNDGTYQKIYKETISKFMEHENGQ